MDVKSAQKNLGSQHFQMGQPQKKENTHRASKTPPGQAWGGGGEKLSFGKKLEPRHLLQPSLDPPKTKHGLKIYIYIYSKKLLWLCGWGACMNAHSFFPLLQNCFLPRNQVNPSLQILSCTLKKKKRLTMRNTLASIVAAAPGRNPQLPNTHKSHGCLELSQELLQFYFRSFPTSFSFSFSFLLLNPVFHQRQKSSPVALLLRRCPLVFFSHTHRQNKQASKQPPPTTPTTLLTPQQHPLTWVSPKSHTKLLKSRKLQKNLRLCTRACCN